MRADIPLYQLELEKIDTVTVRDNLVKYLVL